MGIESYIDQSRPALQHLFNGLNEYDSLRLPSIMDYVDETGLVKMTKQENEAFLQAYAAHFDLEFSRGSLAGSILQIAYIGVKRNSPGRAISPECSKFGVKPGTTAEAFCLGRIIKGIPEGVLIFAGRIQYNHWEEGEPNRTVARNVFRELVNTTTTIRTSIWPMSLIIQAPGPSLIT